jgi:hypothetical protein
MNTSLISGRSGTLRRIPDPTFEWPLAYAEKES